MPQDFILVDPKKSPEAEYYGTMLKAFTKDLRRLMDKGDELLAMFTHNNNGGNYAEMERLCGIDPTTGADVFTMVNGSMRALRGQELTQQAVFLIDRVG